jgi:hypothetical protein
VVLGEMPDTKAVVQLDPQHEQHLQPVLAAQEQEDEAGAGVVRLLNDSMGEMLMIKWTCYKRWRRCALQTRYFQSRSNLVTTIISESIEALRTWVKGLSSYVKYCPAMLHFFVLILAIFSMSIIIFAYTIYF